MEISLLLREGEKHLDALQEEEGEKKSVITRFPLHPLS